MDLIPKNIDIERRQENRGLISEIINKLKNVDGVWVGNKEDRNCPFAPLKHTFTTGIYVRELIIPAGHYIGGEIHIHDHPVFLMEGEIVVITDEGGKHLKAPNYFVSPPGTQRLAYTVTDTKWVTVHANPTNEKDLVKLEEQHIAESFEDFENISLNLKKE